MIITVFVFRFILLGRGADGGMRASAFLFNPFPLSPRKGIPSSSSVEDSNRRTLFPRDAGRFSRLDSVAELRAAERFSRSGSLSEL